MEVGNIDYIDNAVNILNEKHLARIAKDPEFVALNEEIESAGNERRDRKFLSLNYKMRKAENDKMMQDV